MFCPQCGYQQSLDDARFCTRCGLSLELAAEMIATGDAGLARERREVAGVGFMTATVLMLFTFLFVFGLVTLPHLANPVFLVLWIGALVTTLTTGAVGLLQLRRSGFFQRIKERELRLELAKTERVRASLPKPAAPITAGLPRLVEVPSVTEETTHDLPKRRTASGALL